MNRRMRNRTYGGVRGRRGQPRLLLDKNSGGFNASVAYGFGEQLSNFSMQREFGFHWVTQMGQARQVSGQCCLRHHLANNER